LAKPTTGNVKGYYVMMRNLPGLWQKFFTTNTEIKLLFKDNYFFAVQSVSEDGNELPVVPTVGR
jgi:hypothetical protein